MFDHRFLAESAFRAQIGHGHLLFQRAAGRHDLGEQPGQRCSRQRPLIQFAHTAQDLRFALGFVGRGIAFGMPGLLGQLGAGRKQLDQTGVQRVNFAADLTQGYGHGRTVPGFSVPGDILPTGRH